MEPKRTEVGKCIRCDKPVFEDEHGCMDWAVRDSVRAGYGSRHDTCDFDICICDDCLDAVKPPFTHYHPGEELQKLLNTVQPGHCKKCGEPYEQARSNEGGGGDQSSSD